MALGLNTDADVRGPSAPSAVISLSGVTWERDGRRLLDGVDWTVRPGEHWAVVGLNGSGKSSLLAMVNGYLWPTAGHVQVFGQRLGRVPVQDVRRRIGWVSAAMADQIQTLAGERALDVAVSGRYASIGVWVERTPEDEAAARRTLALFDAEALAGRTFSTLSQGERQRVLLSRAWMARPELLVLDEPCTGLDIRAREALLAGLERGAAGAQPPTVVYVTHHAEEVLGFITHALLVKDGRILAQGPKRQVLTSERLTAAYDVPVSVHWRNGRPWLEVIRQG